jgi:uncharacterized membrane protein
MNVAQPLSEDEGRTRQIVHRLMKLTSLPVLLIVARVGYTGHLNYAHILWDLLLAWVPLGFAYLAVPPARVPRHLRLISGIAWLLFLPNAPYLVTEIMHLQNGGGISLLYDVVLLFSVALCGLMLGLVSLDWVQRAVTAQLKPRLGRLFGLPVLGMVGFGIYLGRYRRWNSWDVVLQPVALSRDILRHVVHPVQHWRAWALTLLLALLLAFAYWPLVTLAGTNMDG